MKKLFRRFFKFLFKIILLILIISAGWVLLYRYVNPPVTPLMVIRYWEGAGKIKKKWRDYRDISGYMKLAVIAAEDQKFPLHRGFDLKSIQDAIDDKLRGDSLRGASTISQQTAKNVFLWPEKSWLRKGAEAYFTFLIETIWGKKRILEVYLNVIETGEGVYGVEEAGEIYFGETAKDINKEEAALMAAVLPNPILMSPENPSRYVKERQMWIMEQMDNLGGVRYLRNIE